MESDGGPPIKIHNQNQHSSKKPPRHDGQTLRRERGDKQTEAETQYHNQGSSQSRTQRMNTSLTNTTPVQNGLSDSDAVRSKNQSLSKRRTPKYQDRSEHESDVTENKLPSIRDKDQITTGGFKKKF